MTPGQTGEAPRPGGGRGEGAIMGASKVGLTPIGGVAASSSGRLIQHTYRSKRKKQIKRGEVDLI